MLSSTLKSPSSRPLALISPTVRPKCAARGTANTWQRSSLRFFNLAAVDGMHVNVALVGDKTQL